MVSRFYFYTRNSGVLQNKNPATTGVTGLCLFNGEGL